MTARLALVFAVVSLGLLAACARNADLVRERADRIEAHYKVTPADARTLAASQVKLDSPEARALFTELTEKLPGFTRLAPEDLEPFLAAVTSTTPQGVRERQEELLSPETIRLVSRIRSELTVPREPGPDGAPSRETVCRYEPRFYEAPLLVALARPAADDASEKERQRLVVAFFHPETLVPLRAVLERAPRARFPVAAIPAACELEGIPTRLVERALDRFRALELDVGVLEINPRVLALLAAVARAPAKLEAFTTVVLQLPSLDARQVTEEGLDGIAAIPTEALSRVLSGLSGTNALRRQTRLDGEAALVLKTLAERPASASLLAVLEACSPEFRFEGAHDARALVSIEAASHDGTAAATLERCLARGQVAVESLDEKTTAFLRALVARPEMLEPLRLLHQSWPAWHATPDELDGIAAVASAPAALVPLLPALRQVGFDLASARLGSACGQALADLGRDKAAPLAEALHVLYPKLAVPHTAALRELHELAKAGVTAEDVLRLDAGGFAGALEAHVRQALQERAIKRRPRSPPPR